MQTITITITSPNPANIVLKESRQKKPNITDKLAELLNDLDPSKKALVTLANEG